jgi:hypothetical protein
VRSKVLECILVVVVVVVVVVVGIQKCVADVGAMTVRNGILYDRDSTFSTQSRISLLSRFL